jgi:hypothetical protein|tara:strand:- start:553 stop:927 length:375 start_codon:yes stop_codon:yes gene_type:complete
MNAQELIKKFNLVQITLFKTKTPLTYWLDGGKEENLDRVLEVIDGKENKDFNIWESFYNNTLRTFIKLYPDTKLKPDNSKYKEYNEGYDEGYDYEDGLELTMREGYEYDGPREGFDDWLEGNGY